MFKGLDRMICIMEIMGCLLDKFFDIVIILIMFDKCINVVFVLWKCLMNDYGECVWEGVIFVDMYFRDVSLV